MLTLDVELTPKITKFSLKCSSSSLSSVLFKRNTHMSIDHDQGEISVVALELQTLKPAKYISATLVMMKVCADFFITAMCAAKQNNQNQHVCINQAESISCDLLLSHVAKAICLTSFKLAGFKMLHYELL